MRRTAFRSGLENGLQYVESDQEVMTRQHLNVVWFRNRWILVVYEVYVALGHAAANFGKGLAKLVGHVILDGGGDLR